MGWTNGKQARKKKNIKRMRKIKWEASGLGAPAAKGPAVLIDEIRQQGMMLAYRGVGQGTRSRQSGTQNTGSERSPKGASHRHRRGATG